MTTSSLCVQIPRQPRCSILDPNAPEFIPSDMFHFFDQASCRQSAQLGFEWIGSSFAAPASCGGAPFYDWSEQSSSLSLSYRHQNSRHDSSMNAFSRRCTNELHLPARRIAWESFVLDVDTFTDIVRRKLRVRVPADVARVIVEFSRAQYEMNRANVLMHEAYWSKDTVSQATVLDLCCVGSCAWIHPNLPPDVHQNFQVTAIVAFAPLFVRDNIEEDYTSMSESEDTFDAAEGEFDPYFCAMEIEIDHNENNQIQTDQNFIVENAVDPNFLLTMPSSVTTTTADLPCLVRDNRSFKQQTPRMRRILSESLVSPRWEIVCDEMEIDTSSGHSCAPSWKVRITFNLWTHQIASTGQREFFKNSVSALTVVNDSCSSFEWHNIMAAWSRTKMEMSLIVDGHEARSRMNGFLPCTAVVYDNGAYRGREIAVGKDLLLSDDDEFKFFGFVRQIAADVWNDE